MSIVWPLRIELAIRPQGKGRPRFAKGHAYTPERTRSYEAALAWQAKIAMGSERPLKGPCSVNITAEFKTEPKLWGHRTSRPDADNISKSLDSLNKIVFEDDAQAVDVRILKLNSDKDLITILVWPLELTPIGLPRHPAGGRRHGL